MCIYVRDKVLVLYVLWQTYSEGGVLSLFYSPWCVFHVCWKDKHSCTLMTLKCFWDSVCMCVRVCVCGSLWKGVCSFWPLQWKACWSYSCSVQLRPRTPYTTTHGLSVCVCARVHTSRHGCALWRVMKPKVVFLSSYASRKKRVCSITNSGLFFDCKPFHLHTHIHVTRTRRQQGVPGRDETGSELQMTPKTELPLSDKWDKYTLALTLSLSFCAALPH